MTTVYEIEIQDDAAIDEIREHLEGLCEGVASVELRPTTTSGQKGRLGQIDPALWDIIIRLLDTETVSTVTNTVLSGVAGYILAKGGKVSSKNESGGGGKDPS